MKAFLAAIGRVALLTKSQEQELFGRLERGHEDAPIRARHLGRQAREGLIVANLRLVVYLARRYQGRGVGLDDLVQEGTFGLMRAVERFNPRRGTRFSTYATYWIRNFLQRGFEMQSGTIERPAWVWDLLRRWRKRTDLARATDEELACSLRITARQVRCLKRGARLELRDPALLDNVAEDDPRRMDLAAEAEELNRAIAQLDERSAFVLRLHYGLDGNEPHTLKAIGKQLGVTREAVRQIELRALDKLRARYGCQP